MSQLNWQNVAAPDFSGSLNGFAQFGQLLNGALGGAVKVLDNYDQSQTDSRSKQAIADILSTTDVKSLQDGSFFQTHSADRLNGDVLSLLARRPGDLLDQSNKSVQLDASKENLDFTKFDHTRTKEDYTNLEASKPLAAQLLQAGILSKDEGDASARRAAILSMPENAAIYAKLNLGQQQALVKAPGDILAQNQQLQKGAFDVVGAGLNNDMTRVNIAGGKIANTTAQFNEKTNEWRVGNERADRTDVEAANRAKMAIGGTYKDAPSAQAALERERPNLTSGAYAILAGQLNQEFGGNVYTSGSTAGGGFGNGGNINASSPAWTTQVGGGQLPASVQTIGDAYNYGKKVLIPGNKGDASLGLPPDKGSSAIGAYQLIGSTMLAAAKAVYGDGYLNKNIRDPQVQDALAEHIFNGVKGNPAEMKKQWASLTPQKIAQIAASGWNWNTARGIITSGETSSNAFSPGVAASQRVSEIAATNGQGRFDAARGSTLEAPINVALRLRGTKDAPGTFNNVPTSFLTSQINKIVQAATVNGVAKINATQAGQILEEALAGKNHSFWGQVNLGNGMQLDQATIDNRVHDATNNGGFNDRQQQQASAENTAAILAQAQARNVAAQNAVEQFKHDAATMPRYAMANKNRIFAEAAIADAQYRAAATAASNQQPQQAQDVPGSSWVDTLSSFLPSFGQRNSGRPGASAIR